MAGAASDRHADGEVVELPEAEAGPYVGEAGIAVAHVDATGTVIGIRISAIAAPKAPAMWFAELAEDTATPPATNLLAFTGFDVEPGRLLDRAALLATGAWTEDQLGAIRLYRGTSELDQVYVSPQWRRRHVGTVLTYAAGILVAARGGSPVWSDGQRTADGDRFAKASIGRHRAAALTSLAPPMTPFEHR